MATATAQEALDRLNTIHAELRDFKERTEKAETANADLDVKIDKMEADYRESLTTIRAELATANRATMSASLDETVRRYAMPEKMRDNLKLHSDDMRFSFVDGVQIRGYQIPNSTLSCYGLLDEPEVRSEWQERAQRTYDDWAMARVAGQLAGCSRQIDEHYRRQMNRELSRVFTDATGVGAAFHPTQTLSSVARESRDGQFGRVAGLFQRVPINGNDIKLPFATNTLQPYIQDAISTDDPSRYTASSISTADRSIVPSDWAILAVISRNASADSILATMPLLRQMIIEAMQDGEEDAIINGDSDGTHYHTGLVGMTFGGRWAVRGGSADHAKAWPGLMREADAASATIDLGVKQTAAGFNELVRTMGSRFVSSSQAAFIVSAKFAMKMATFDEVETAEKFGALAGILRGAPLSIYGKPVVPSFFMSDELNASGIYDNSTTDKTAALCVDTRRRIIYQRETGTIGVETRLSYGVDNLVMTMRETFKSIDASGTANVALGYNLTP